MAEITCTCTILKCDDVRVKRLTSSILWKQRFKCYKKCNGNNFEVRRFNMNNYISMIM